MNGGDHGDIDVAAQGCGDKIGARAVAVDHIDAFVADFAQAFDDRHIKAVFLQNQFAFHADILQFVPKDALHEADDGHVGAFF